ncbi:interleukin-15 receptor subunit alpha isoform X2 [Stegostoma tigrinum]|nr:interleukin-15 receptor subunit alpha isoform X2 [Stegostoma tigrinum]
MDAHFEVGHRLRLKCQSGYKRKAGTSNLIRCQNNSKQVKWSEPNLECITTPVEATSVYPAISAATPGSLSDHYTASTMDIKTTSALASYLSPALTTLTAPIESATVTAPTKSASGCNQTSSSSPIIADTTGLGLLATAWTAVRPSVPSSSMTETEFPAAVLPDSTQKATAETTVTYSTDGTTGTEPITTKTALAERTVNPATASETASDVTGSIGTTEFNQTATADRNIGLIVGTSASILFISAVCTLFLLWIFAYKKKIGCIRSQEYDATPVLPIEVQTVTCAHEAVPLQQETER